MPYKGGTTEFGVSVLTAILACGWVADRIGRVTTLPTAAQVFLSQGQKARIAQMEDHKYDL